MKCRATYFANIPVVTVADIKVRVLVEHLKNNYSNYCSVSYTVFIRYCPLGGDGRIYHCPNNMVNVNFIAIIITELSKKTKVKIKMT